MPEQVKAAETCWSGLCCYCFGTKRPWVQIPPPRQQNAWSEAVCDRGAIAASDQLRDYRNLFRWRIPAVGAVSAVDGGGRLRLRSGYRGLAHDRDAKLATLIHPARPRNQQVRALSIDKRRRGTTALPW
jgi:hypothetical protein